MKGQAQQIVLLRFFNHMNMSSNGQKIGGGVLRTRTGSCCVGRKEHSASTTEVQ